MLKLFYSIITIFTSVIIVSCSAIKSGISENDKLLLEKITGKWEAKNRGVIELKPDGTFIDTILTPLSFVENTYVVNFVLSGKYEIKDSNLHFYDAAIEYSRDIINKRRNDLVYIFDPRRISLEDDFMMLQEFRMFFSDTVEQRSVKGKWENENYACVYEHNSKQKYKCGKIKEIFIFNTDSTCRFERKYLFNTSLSNESNTKTFYYNHPHLEIESLENALVVFHENKMVWFQNDPVFYKKREK